MSYHRDVALGGSVLRQQGTGGHARGAGYVDDGPAPLLQHGGQHVAGHPCGRVDVQGDQLLHLWRGVAGYMRKETI